VRLVLLREIPPDASLRQQWDALVMRASRPQVFYTYEWALAVQRAYGDTVRPWLFLAYDEQDAICGIAALARGIAGGQVSFLSATTADYCDFLSQPEDKPAFVAAVLAELRKQGIGDIALANLPADSDTCSALREAGERQGYHLFTRTAYTCALIFLGQLERGKDGKRVAPGQKRIRRFAKAMVSEGPICFDHSRSWEDVAPILPEFIQAHVARLRRHQTRDDVERGRLARPVGADQPHDGPGLRLERHPVEGVHTPEPHLQALDPEAGGVHGPGALGHGGHCSAPSGTSVGVTGVPEKEPEGT